MKTNLASIEIHYLIKELQFLIDSRVDNIYNPERDELILQLHLPGKGKQILKIFSGKMLYLTSLKEPSEQPSQFCMLLRKHLSNSRLRSIRQLESERIIELIFEKEEIKKLIIELFGKGNIILCDKNDNIISALIYHKWKDREIKAKLKYSYPKMPYNLFNLKLDNLKELFKNSKTESIVKCLAIELGLGGIYSEEICLLSKIDKNTKPSSLEEKETKGIFENISGIINKKIRALIVYKNNEAEDIIPFELKIYENFDKKEFKTYNEAFDYYFLNKLREEKPKTKQEKEIERLKRIIAAQEESIKELEQKEADERNKANMVYQNYGLIKNILTELKKITEKYGWKEIENKLKEYKLIKSLDAKDKTIEIEL